MGIVDPMAIGAPLWAGSISFGWDAGILVLLGVGFGLATAGVLSRVARVRPRRGEKGRLRLATAS